MALTGLTNLQPLHIKTVGIGTFDNTVSIGGTLTYEDVTNVDAIGIITARSGVNVSGGQLDVGSNIKIGNAGVITATSFVGDGSGLTGAGPSLTGSTNNTIVTVTGANAIQGESTLTYDGTYLDIGGGVTRFTKQGSYNSLEIGYGQNSNQNAFIDLIGDTTYTDYGTRIIRNGQNGANAETDILHRGTGSLNLHTSDAANIVFKTNGNNERFRVDSNGFVGVNFTSTQNWGAKFRVGGLLLSDQGAGSPYVFGKLSSVQDFVIGRTDTSGTLTEHFRIKAGGNVLIGTDTGSEKLCIKRDDAIGPTITLENDSNKAYINNWGSSGGSGRTNRFEINATLQGQASYCAPYHTFMTGGVGDSNEKIRINSNGKVGIGFKFNYTMNSQSTDLVIGDGGGGRGITFWTAGAADNQTISFQCNENLSRAEGEISYGPTATSTAADRNVMMFRTNSNERLRIQSTGTVQAHNHLTSRNGIVQTQQVTSETRYSGSAASVDLIVGGTFTPKTSAPRFLIQIFCPVNTSDDSDAGGSNRNDYFYGRIEYRKSGGGWIECNNQGSTSNQGGFASHIELSPNRTGNQTTDYWSGNRYRMEHKCATILVTNVGDCGSSGTVQFKLRCYSYSGNFIQIGQPHGSGSDDNYPVQPWGFTVFELAPDSNSYTAY